jgi:hypothetical protein
MHLLVDRLGSNLNPKSLVCSHMPMTAALFVAVHGATAAFLLLGPGGAQQGRS